MADLPPDGVYPGRIVGFNYKKTAKSEADYIELTCIIEDANSKYNGRRLECDLWFNNEKNAKRSMESLVMAGWDGQDVAKMDGIGSKMVDLVVQTDEPQEKPDAPGTYYPARCKVAFINEPGSSVTGRAMNQAEAGTFMARLMALKVTMGVGKQAGGPAPAAAPANAPPQGKIPI